MNTNLQSFAKLLTISSQHPKSITTYNCRSIALVAHRKLGLFSGELALDSDPQTDDQQT